MKQSNIIVIDWGTTHFRAYLLNSSGDRLKKFDNEKGCKHLKKDEFEPVLLDLLQLWDLPFSTPIIACGMVGSLIGWQNVPYENIHDFHGFAMTKLSSSQTKLNICIVHGLCQHEPHANVMRGEETQLAGFLTFNPSYSGFLMMPGTHCKWVLLEEGQIKSFYSFMTGELFALLSEKSTLANLSSDPFDFSMAEFSTSLDHLKHCSSIGLSSSLFHIRASSILGKEDMKSPYAYLSAMLIAEEFRSMQKTHPNVKNISMIASPKITPFYKKVAQAFSYDLQELNSENMTIMGLHYIFKESQT